MLYASVEDGGWSAFDAEAAAEFPFELDKAAERPKWLEVLFAVQSGEHANRAPITAAQVVVPAGASSSGELLLPLPRETALELAQLAQLVQVWPILLAPQGSKHARQVAHRSDRWPHTLAERLP